MEKLNLEALYLLLIHNISSISSHVVWLKILWCVFVVFISTTMHKECLEWPTFETFSNYMILTPLPPSQGSLVQLWLLPIFNSCSSLAPASSSFSFFNTFEMESVSVLTLLVIPDLVLVLVSLLVLVMVLDFVSMLVSLLVILNLTTNSLFAFSPAAPSSSQSNRIFKFTKYCLEHDLVGQQPAVLLLYQHLFSQVSICLHWWDRQKKDGEDWESHQSDHCCQLLTWAGLLSPTSDIFTGRNIS